MDNKIKLGVYAKLMDARVQLAGLPLKKSGHNAHMKYRYFELQDFLPSAQKIFFELGLCSVISFTKEMATMTIVDLEGGGEIIITSPMAESALKACSPIQSLGASETYSRRYLWVSALEVLENDVVDNVAVSDALEQLISTMSLSKTIADLRKNYEIAVLFCNNNKEMLLEVEDAKNVRRLALLAEQGESK